MTITRKHGFEFVNATDHDFSFCLYRAAPRV